MARKRACEADQDEPAPQSTPKKLRFGEPAATPTKNTPTKSALKQSTGLNGTPKSARGRTEEAVTPSNRSTKKEKSYTTPSKQTTNGTGKAASATPQLVQNADRSARRKKNRNLIERNFTGGQSDDEQDEPLADPVDSEDIQEAEDGEPTEDADHLVATTEGGTASDPTTPAKRGRGRPPGAKNKRTPTPPFDIPAHERYFFENRPAAAKHTSNTPNSVPLLSHAAYLTAIRRCDAKDPHTSAHQNLYEHHAASFSRWAFELQQNYTVVLHGYGSKRRLLKGFMDYLHSSADPAAPPVTVVANAHHPGFTLRSMLQVVARGVGLDPADLPGPPAVLLEAIERHMASPEAPRGRVYLAARTVTARPMTTAAAMAALMQLARIPQVSVLMTADNPAFPLLWPSSTRDALNVVMHDATTFLPYDSADAEPDDNEEADGDAAPVGEITELGTSAVDAVAELLGKRGAEAASRERVSWVLKSLPENARGLYRILVSEILTAADANGDGGEWGGFLGDEDEDDEFGESVPTKKGKGGRSGPAEELPGVDSKMIYQKASEEFLCSSEMAFRGLLREFLDHAMVVIRRDGVGGSGGEMLGVEMGRAEMEGVLEDLCEG